MRLGSVTTLLAWTSHALAWGAGLALALGPVYQGASVTAVAPGEPSGEVVRNTATLVEVNGIWVIWLLLVPVLLTYVGLLAIHFARYRRSMRQLLLWGSALALLGFCGVAIFSIGIFYLPALLVLLLAAFSAGRKSHN